VPRVGVAGVYVATPGAIVKVRPRGVALQYRVRPALPSLSGHTNLRIDLQALHMSAFDYPLHIAAIRDQLLGSNAAVPIHAPGLAGGNDEVNARGLR